MNNAVERSNETKSRHTNHLVRNEGGGRGKEEKVAAAQQTSQNPNHLKAGGRRRRVFMYRTYPNAPPRFEEGTRPEVSQVALAKKG